MKYFIFRNMTVERFFQNMEASFSGYEDISAVNPGADRYVWFYLAPLKPDQEAVAEEIRHYAELFRLALQQIPPQKMVIAMTIQVLYNSRGVLSGNAVREAVLDYNASLLQTAAAHQNVKIVDIASFLKDYPAAGALDWKFYFISQMGLNPRLAVPFQEWFGRQIAALEMKRRKCLVLDLDNTLWGGIVGEDGIEGIALGGDYPGKAYKMFQEQILGLKKEGVILALCSKNNIEDVRQVWRQHPDSVLKEEDFAALKVNWTNKADNVAALARELNIGTDSMVFVDDNPAEREIVRSNLPEVAVPDFPEQPYMLPVFFKRLVDEWFTVYALTDEDRAKTEQYRSNALRSEAVSQFADMAEYIASLEIELSIAEVTDITLPRAAQMTQKTNQFNITTRRYSEDQLRGMLCKGGRIFTLGVYDRFGDSGITGVCIVTVGDHSAHIDSLLLSCRILGKEIEGAFLKYILRTLHKGGVTRITAEFIPTAKNMQVAGFFEKNGFSVTGAPEGGGKTYELELNSGTLPELPAIYKYN